MDQSQHEFLVFDVSGGFCAIAWNHAGIRHMQLPSTSRAAAERALARRLPQAHAGVPTPEVMAAVSAIKRYFAGEQIDFSGVRLDLSAQERFHRRIYDVARQVAWGKTTTYGAVAKELGAGPEAARDVGQAMAKNPVPLIIPCHRVLAAGGKLGGFSAPGGTTTKIRMLALEGVLIETQPAQQALF